jgi:hypothetical protein
MTERLNEVLNRFPGFTTDTRDHDESPVYVVCEDGWYWYIPSNLPVLGEWKDGDGLVQLNDGLIAPKPAPQRAGQLKHFNWQFEGQRGRVAVLIENDVIEVQQISGKAPPWDSRNATCVAWHNTINSAFHGPNGETLCVYAQNLSATRVNRCAVQRRYGMSGARDYLLRIERNARLGDYPIAAKLHVSMAGKLNEGMRMWLGDFAELKNAILGDLDDETPESGIVIEEATLPERLSFYQAKPWPTPTPRTDFASLYADEAD